MTEAPSTATGKPKTVLLVEDDPAQRLLYSESLRNWGYRVVTAENGQQAMSLLPTTQPDLVIVDVAMPGMDGIETMRRLFARDHHLPVIINTAYSAYQFDVQAAVADACLVKSSDLTELRETVRRVLARTTAPA